ncbi:hypothetical protein BT96DRAFT_174641 [Gymnopus androsaceus JB14]|uniref:Uncharacterized protein n=1 Tax=Gymnopus androsaceus JB14 TaxID=1447944 RepID=A0A6A4IB57_9AGAR|nr:hypothetical protein BT96DRAFT_174641 [Gymnopus androsaceus JB14]
MVVDRRPTRSYQAGCLIDGPCEGGFVSIDVNMITMSPTDEEAGQYHRSGRGSKEWVHYPDPSTAPKPRTNYGYYKSVVDFGPENRNKMWNLLTAMRTSLAGDPRPAFLILARKDYKFSIPPGYFPKDIDWTKECEPSLLVKISDYKIPANGRLAFQDMLEDAPFEDVLFSLSSSRTPRAPPSNFNMFTFNGDGIYPVQIIKNDEGVVICVKVHFHSR